MHITIHNAKRVGNFTLGYAYRNVDKANGTHVSQMYMIIITAKGRKFASKFGVDETIYDKDWCPVDICDIADEIIHNEMKDVEYSLFHSIALEKDEWVEVFEDVQVYEP